jgi:hypothetical protein
MIQLWLIMNGDYESTNLDFIYFSKEEAFKRFEKIYETAYFPRNKTEDYFEHDECHWTKVMSFETEDDLP